MIDDGAKGLCCGVELEWSDEWERVWDFMEVRRVVVFRECGIPRSWGGWRGEYGVRWWGAERRKEILGAKMQRLVFAFSLLVVQLIRSSTPRWEKGDMGE